MYSTRKEVVDWLISIKIYNYIINEDLTVDVNSDVDISNKKLKEIPVKFGKINGISFNCSNNNLTNLEGCPDVIYGSFYCNYNNLTSLEHCPQVIKGSFDCANNELTSLKELPNVIFNNYLSFENNKIKEHDLAEIDFNKDNFSYIYSDFNEDGDKEEFFNKVNYYKNIKEENKLLKELSNNNNNVKLNKKL